MTTPKPSILFKKKTIVRLNAEQMPFIVGGRAQVPNIDTTMMTTGSPGMLLNIHKNL